MRFNKENYLLLGIFILAFIIRAAFVIQSTNIPSSDAYAYDNLGLSISQGAGYVDSNGAPHSHYPPFYPVFLSIIYYFFGHSYLAVRITQSLIGALTCVLIYLIGKKVNSKALGIIAAFISIVYFPFIKSAELLLTELVFTFFLCLIVYYLFKIQEDVRLKNYIILGLLLGFALLTKSAMSLFPFFIIPVFVYSAKEKIMGSFKKYIIVLLFFGLSIMPWIMRNYTVYHKLGVISTQSGITFYSSYCPPGGIFGKLAGGEDPVVREAGKISSPILYSDFLMKETFEFIVHNPFKVLVLEFQKIIYLWVPFDWEIVGNRWFNFVYAMSLPFFVLGFILACAEIKKYFPILVPIVYFQFTSLIFYGSPRFRLPIEPFIFILSILGILKIHDWIKRRNLCRI